MGHQRLETKPSDVWLFLDGATSHLTAYPCKSTTTSEVICKLHERMDTSQMNPEAIFADMAFQNPHDMQAFYRMHNVKIIPTRPHTPWPNRAEMGVRLFKKFLLALVDTASKNLDQTTVAQITPAQLMRKAATVRNTHITIGVRRLWSWPWDEDQGISQTQLQWIQSSWHPHQPSKIFSTKKFKNWPWRLILKFSNEKISVHIFCFGCDLRQRWRGACRSD